MFVLLFILHTNMIRVWLHYILLYVINVQEKTIKFDEWCHKIHTRCVGWRTKDGKDISNRKEVQVKL